MKLRTVGYESCDILPFVTYLKSQKVDLVIDIRKNPLSRKKGFSKNKLAENLKTKKIQYLHMPGLGVPSAWRKLAKAHFISREKMFNDYVKKILPLQKNDLTEILRLAKINSVTLLCYEADALDCHRNYVAKNLKRKAKGLQMPACFTILQIKRFSC